MYIVLYIKIWYYILIKRKVGNAGKVKNMTKDGFIQRYGNGETAVNLWECLQSLEKGEKRLVFDDGSQVTLSTHNFGTTPDDIFEKYGNYGVREIIHKYTCDEIHVGIAKQI